MSLGYPHPYNSGEKKILDLFDGDFSPGVERLRKQIDHDVNEMLLHTPSALRGEIWVYSEITDDKVFQKEMIRARKAIEANWSLATVLLEELSSEDEYKMAIKRIRDAYLVLDALENSGKGPGESV